MDNYWEHFVYVQLPILAVAVVVGFLMRHSPRLRKSDFPWVTLYGKSPRAYMLIYFLVMVGALSIALDLFAAGMDLIGRDGRTLGLETLDKYLFAAIATFGHSIRYWRLSQKAQEPQ